MISAQLTAVPVNGCVWKYVEQGTLELLRLSLIEGVDVVIQIEGMFSSTKHCAAPSTTNQESSARPR
jgi:hypothetical protein